jgi:hypothetical protein
MSYRRVKDIDYEDDGFDDDYDEEEPAAAAEGKPSYH